MTKQTTNQKEEGQMAMNGNNGNGTRSIYSPQRIAQILEVKVSFVNRELREGKMRGFKVGKSWRITQDAFDDYCSNRIGDGNGKRSVSEATKAKIKFHANVRHIEKLPTAVDMMIENINKIKQTLPELGTFEKFSKLMKMKTLVLTKAEKEERLVNKDEYLGSLAETAYPGMKDLLDIQPDELEEHFLQLQKKPEKIVARVQVAARLA